MKKRVAIYNPYLETRGGGEKVCLAMAEYLSSGYDVTLMSKSQSDLKKLGDYFSLDLSKCKHVDLSRRPTLLSRIRTRLHLPARLNNMINEYFDYRAIRNSNYDIFINNCYKSNMPCPSKSGIYMCMFPQEFNYSHANIKKRLYHKSIDLIEKLLYHKSGIGIIKSYPIITANSSYTRSWINKYWGLDNDDIHLLYPICENMNNNKIKKEKIILNVGRFFSNSGENHYKCQDKLLESFKGMTNLHESGWRLCLIGSVAEDIDSLKYLLNLYRESQNYPVDIITNAPFSVLKDYFAKTSIYWHATGMGNNENEHPEKQEHFGITTVEAMSAGAVPVVINAAGQKETIIHQKNGFLWNNEKELANYTKKIAEDNSLFLDMSKSSITSSKQFNKQSFEKILSEIIKQL